MRFGWRGILAGVGALLLGSMPSNPSCASPISENPPVRLTVEIEWKSPNLPVLPEGIGTEPVSIEAELTSGRIVSAVAWPGTGRQPTPEPRPASQAWWLGSAPSGCVRARVEAPLTSSILVREGNRVTAVPLVHLLEAPQRSLAPSGTSIQLRRLPWDDLEVSLANGGNGVVAPGATIPLRVGFNILSPEITEAVVRIEAQLRPATGDEVLQRWSGSHVVAANAIRPPVTQLDIQAPRVEGSYVVEIVANWQPVEAAESSRLSWLLRRRRKGGASPGISTRRITFAVLNSGDAPDVRPNEVRPSSGLPVEIADSVDLVRDRGNRLVATGRTPAAVAGNPAWVLPDAALVEPQFRDRLRGWFLRGSEAATLEAADPSGLAWSAIGLKVPHPGRTHRLTLTVVSGDPTALEVALVAPGGSGGPRVLLDARAWGSHVVEGSERVSCSWPVWPDSGETVLVLINRGTSAPIRVGTVVLEELTSDLPPAQLAETHPDAPRCLGLLLSTPHALDRFGGGDETVWDGVAAARNLAAYLDHCGLSMAVLPDSLSDRERRGALDGQAAENSVGPDRLNLTLMMLARRHLSAWIDLRLDGPLPGLPAPESAEAVRRGLVRLNHAGVPDQPRSYYPLHADVQAALGRLVERAIEPGSRHPNLAGILIRLGPGASLPGGPESGLDDATYRRFIASVFEPAQARLVPGQDDADPSRFAARSTYVAGPGRKPWLAWRSREMGQLYRELNRITRSKAPGARLAVSTPTVDHGPAGREARRADIAGLPAPQAWLAVGFDLSQWSHDEGPLVLRTVDASDDPLARDLASHPDLDTPVAARPDRGILLAPPPIVAPNVDPNTPVVLSVAPSGIPVSARAEELGLGHALAALDAHWFVLDSSAVAGREPAMARFARIVRALPATREAPGPLLRPETGLAARSWTAAGHTYLGLANDTPFTLWLDAELRTSSDAPVDDLGRQVRLKLEPARSSQRLIVEVAPHDIATLRIGAPTATVTRIATTRPPRDHALEERFQVVSTQLQHLTRLADAGSLGVPPNPGFEPDDRAASPSEDEGEAASSSVAGWSLTGQGGGTATIDRDNPREGLGSLKIVARAAETSVVSEAFTPPGGSELFVRAWFRADPSGTPVRVWIEGQAGDRPIRLLAPLDVPSDWVERKVRAAALPEEGLDWLRLRFELTAPGQLWIDDLTIDGGRLSEPDRRALRDLMTAQVAYREGRWADFARLASSRWIRPIDPNVPAVATSADDSSRAGSATGLSPARRIR